MSAMRICVLRKQPRRIGGTSASVRPERSVRARSLSHASGSSCLVENTSAEFQQGFLMPRHDDGVSTLATAGANFM